MIILGKFLETFQMKKKSFYKISQVITVKHIYIEYVLDTAQINVQ